MSLLRRLFRRQHTPHSLADLVDFQGMTDREIRAAVVDLCRDGLLTCTSGRPGEDGATYAVAWLPLDSPEQYPQSVRELHDRNMAAFQSRRADSNRHA